MKRQRGRNRKPGGGGGGGGGHNPNRAFESNGPDNVKIRGAAQHVYERYQQLARDAFASGDRVLAENYLQHAEHYFRVLRTLQPQRPVSEIAARDAFASGFDIDFEDEGGAEGDGEGVTEGGEDAASDQPQPYARDDRQGGERHGGERQGGEFRRDRDRDRDREFRGERRDGDQRPPREGGEQRADGEGGFREGGRRESRRERFERRREEQRRNREGEGGFREGGSSDPMAVVEPKAAPLPVSEPEDDGSPRLRAQDGAESQMPAFLRQAVPAAAPAEAEAAQPEAEAGERPRRARTRRRPETFEAAEGDAPAEEQA